jgi:steroid 5-alpha reductase family enzyme
MLIYSLLFLLTLFFLVWHLSRRLNNYSIVDVAWSLAFAPVAIGYACSGAGWEWRRWTVALLVSGWSLRLGLYLWGRVAKHHPKEDARYAVLREEWKANLSKAFFFFFLAQGVLVWVLMLPVYLICQNTAPYWHWTEIAGTALWGLALVGEGIADAQLKRFKSKTSDKLAVCEEGLWHYSRHPNYFFQSLLWWGLFLMALPVPWGCTALVAPLAMLHFLLNVTGIPLTEQLAVKSKGQSYIHYQQTTSAFVPWVKRASAKMNQVTSSKSSHAA